MFNSQKYMKTERSEFRANLGAQAASTFCCKKQDFFTVYARLKLNKTKNYA